MRWRGRKSSSHIEDRRGMSVGRISGGGRGAGGLLRLVPVLIRFLGVKGTAVLVVGVLAYGYFTDGGLPGNTGSAVDSAGVSSPADSDRSSVSQSAEEQELAEFVAVVLADTEEAWRSLFEAQGKHYREPTLVLFRQAVRSACGIGQSAMGPFYCPADQKVYLDLSFFDELSKRYGAPGDFAQAYVIAHEVGHHVQTLSGISEKVARMKRGLDSTDVNKLSVLQELQADCFAGIWAHNADHSRQLLEAGDIEEGLTAASAIGDDRLQKQARGYVTPESFTHGSSAQRVHWFRVGMDQGSLSACNTFEQAKK